MNLPPGNSFDPALAGEPLITWLAGFCHLACCGPASGGVNSGVLPLI